LEEIEVAGTIILKWGCKYEAEEFNWIFLLQDGCNRIAFVSMVMNIWFHKRGREFFDYIRK
jgi:hypothetical protein